MTTFSQLVDKIVAERQRPDLLQTIASFANQQVRLAHSRPGAGSYSHFDANRYEERVVLTSDSPAIWATPSATRFNAVEAIWSHRYFKYVPQRAPAISRAPSDEPYARLFWYRSGPSIVISGLAANDTVDISYFMFPRTLEYKIETDRVTRYDSNTDTYVLTAGGGTPTEEQLASETHWMLQRWPSMLEQGLRSAVFRHLGDESRSRTAYSAFEQERLFMWQQEPSSN